MAAPVTPGSRRWNELVGEAIDRDRSRNWFLGDAALEIAPMGSDRSNTGAIANLTQYADEIGVGLSSLMEYRRVADAWPHTTRVACAWKVHQMLTTRPELIRPGMTVTQAHTALGQQTVGRTGPQSEPSARASAAVSLVDNFHDRDMADRFVAGLSKEGMENLAEAALHREAAAHGVETHHRRTVPDPEPEWHRLTRRIGVDLVIVTGLINGLRTDGQHALADRATGELREVLADGLAQLEVIPDTIEGLT